MRTLSALLLVCLLPSLANAQLFRRNRGCPDGNCQPYYGSPSSAPIHPSIAPEPGVAVEPAKDESAIDFTEIPVDLMVRNENGNCVWCAGEPVFVSAGWESLRGIAHKAMQEGFPNKAIREQGNIDVSNLVSALKDAGVPYKLSRDGSMDIFKYAKEEGVAVYVQIRVIKPNDHAVAVVGMDETHVRVLDNNGPKKIQTWTMERFKRVWNGVACCPLHRKNKKPKEPATPAVTPTTPKEPVGPVAPTTPAPDLSKIIDGLNKLVDSVTAINNNVGTVNKSVGTLNDKVTAIDQRLVTVEGRLAASSPGNQSPPPSTVTPDPNIKVIQDKLAKLEANLKQSGTLHISATQK